MWFGRKNINVSVCNFWGCKRLRAVGSTSLFWLFYLQGNESLQQGHNFFSWPERPFIFNSYNTLTSWNYVTQRRYQNKLHASAISWACLLNALFTSNTQEQSFVKTVKKHTNTHIKTPKSCQILPGVCQANWGGRGGGVSSSFHWQYRFCQQFRQSLNNKTSFLLSHGFIRNK